MTARDALAAGDLTRAVELQSTAAADAAGQLFLVELLALAGRYREAWDRLAEIDEPSADWPAARRRFRRLLRAANRRRLGRMVSLTDPPDHARFRAMAHRAIRRGQVDRAVRSIDRADTVSPHLFGHIDGREFDGLRDADDRFASVVELLIGSVYTWLPWEHVRRLTLAPAKHPLDVAFRPGRVRISDGTERDVFVPLIYPGRVADDALRLGQDTDLTSDGGPVIGLGAKLLMLGDGGEGTLADCTQIDVRGVA